MESPFNFGANWFETWMKQSQSFFEITEKSLKQVFEKDAYKQPQDYLEQITQWQEMLKKHWQTMQLSSQQQAVQNYWQFMTNMSCEATDRLVKAWLQRANEKDPVKNIRELYELWLNICHEVYQQSTATNEYQKAYGDMLNSTMQFWKTALNK